MAAGLRASEQDALGRTRIHARKKKPAAEAAGFFFGSSRNGAG